MKAKYKGLYSQQGLRRGDIFEIDRFIYCVEHYAIWYKKRTNVSLDIIEKNSLKEHLPVAIFNSRGSLSSKDYEII